MEQHIHRPITACDLQPCISCCPEFDACRMRIYGSHLLIYRCLLTQAPDLSSVSTVRSNSYAFCWDWKTFSRRFALAAVRTWNDPVDPMPCRQDVSLSKLNCSPPWLSTAKVPINSKVAHPPNPSSIRTFKFSSGQSSHPRAKNPVQMPHVKAAEDQWSNAPPLGPSSSAIILKLKLFPALSESHVCQIINIGSPLITEGCQ